MQKIYAASLALFLLTWTNGHADNVGIGSVNGVKTSYVLGFEKRTTKTGVPVYYQPATRVPLFEVELVFALGADSDALGRSGLTHLTSKLLRHGSIGMDENMISERLDELAAGVDVSVTRDWITLSAYGLNQNSKEIVDLLFKILREPTFPDRSFRRVKQNQLEGLEKLPESPSGLASYAFERLLFNGTDRARPVFGTKADLERIQLGDVKNAYRTLFRKDLLHALVIGGSNESEVLSRVIDKLDEFPCQGCHKPVASRPLYQSPQWRQPSKKALLVPRTAMTEAHVRMGFVSVPRLHPDYYPLRLAEAILSGPFGSRFNTILREKLNLTYSADAGFSFGLRSGYFVVSTATSNQKVATLISETRSILNRFSQGDITSDELRTAKDYLNGAFPLGLRNLYSVASTYFGGLLSGLSPDFLDTFNSKIEAVTLEQMRKAIQRHFKHDRMLIVVVGEPKQLKKEFKKSRIVFDERDGKSFL